jgi:hypothetical protein
MTIQGPFITVQIDWKLLLASVASLVLLPILTDLISNDVGELLRHWSKRLVCWAAGIQPPASREIREGEWLGQLDETPGTIPKLLYAIGIATYAPFTSRQARGLPLFRDQVGQLLWKLVRWSQAAVVRATHPRRWRRPRRASRSVYLTHSRRRIRMFLAQPTDVPDTGRLIAWCGTLLLVLGLIYLGMGWRGLIDFGGSRPWPVLIGWGVMRLTITLDGHRSVVLAAGSTTLVMALGLALYTRNYHSAPLWVNAVAIGSTVIGATAAVPVLTLLVVCLANLVLWILIGAAIIVIVWIVAALSSDSDTRDRAAS